MPLLTKAKELKDTYDDEANDYVFPSISNTHLNGYLKEIADVVGIEFNLTHHILEKHLLVRYCYTMMCLWRL